MIQCMGIVVKRGDMAAESLAKEVATWITDCGYRVCITSNGLPLQAAKVMPMRAMVDCVDMMLVLGGDGTLLGVGRCFIGTGIPILGINMGRLGFLTDTPAGNVPLALSQVLAGEFKTIEHISLKADVLRDGKTLASGYAMNDVVIQRNNSRPIELEVHIREQLAFRLHADGLILATPAGSTAYALSSGGPIIHPSVHALALVPICPHTLSNRPIVISADDTVEMHLSANPQTASLNLDGEPLIQLAVNDAVRIHQGGKITLIYLPEHHYYKTLRSKLHWADYIVPINE
ncbi:MAG: NAD(+)/NADH kinase [Mariprofundaceae bacterium]|nr:NAD(+)/NADH kinase [Mariprofundaceae bacterium]